MPIRGARSARAGSVTELLQRWSAGDGPALEHLIQQVYGDLRRLARSLLRGERPGHTLQPTGLVHEAFMRLSAQRGRPWPSRGHFFAWASRSMRFILVDHARSRAAAKRGGGNIVCSIDELREQCGELADPAAEDPLSAVLRLDDALSRLDRLDEQQARIVELRLFVGLTVEETANAMQISVATVKREWATARAWLLRELAQADDNPSRPSSVATKNP